MKPSINYDFSEFIRIGDSFVEGVVDATVLEAFKQELNLLFNDATCQEVVFTKNDDKPFFGLYVIPYIKELDVVSIMQSSDPTRLNRYKVEIDSSLFNPVVGVTSREFIAFVLHDVSSLIGDASCIECFRRCLDEYYVNNRTCLKLIDSMHYSTLLSFGILTTLQAITSIFEKEEAEIANEFLMACRLNDDLYSGFNKIKMSGLNMKSSVANKFLPMIWILNIYSDIPHERIPAIKVLRSILQLSSSKLEKDHVNIAIDSINRIDSTIQESTISLPINEGFKELMRDLRYKGIRSLEDDIFEFSMRINNIEDEDDAIYLMRQINTRMSIIDDYLTTEKDISDASKKRWSAALEKFGILRDKLSKMTVYHSKNYGIYVNYPEIKLNNY